MLPTFVIGLREGLEATLIVGIVAAFLAQQGRRTVLAKVWLVTGLALAISGAIGVLLQIASADLAPRGQERFETVVGLAAAAMVTWMVVHLRSQARDVRHGLEIETESAFEKGSEGALVTMVFFGVLREGLEMVVFVIAAFHANSNGVASGTGVVLGLAVAVVAGYAMYKGGLRVDLNRFFRVTGLVLVIIAAGLVMTAVHTAHEGAWIRFGQQQLFSLSWFAPAGSIRSSLVTGVFGIQLAPTRIEVIGWLAYLVPMTLVVIWPRRRSSAPVTEAAR